MKILVLHTYLIRDCLFNPINITFLILFRNMFETLSAIWVIYNTNNCFHCTCANFIFRRSETPYTDRKQLIWYLGVIQKVRSLRRGGRGGGSHWTANKKEQGEGVLACVYLRFLTKMVRFSKLSFIVILQFFLLIITAVWNIKQTIMKDYKIRSC